MPYIPKARRKEVETNRTRATDDGDFNFLYSLEYIGEFILKPSYATIAKIRKASIDPTKLESVDALEAFLTFNGVPALTRQVARDLAFQEFYRRVASKYEDEAMAKNGDLEEYRLALLAVQQKFTEAVQ